MLKTLTGRKKRAKDISRVLSELYPNPPVPLEHKDPFTLLIAVLLSAQCTDERVNKVTPALFSLADNPKDMAKQSVTDIKAIIRPCGLSPQKSKAIKDLSQIVIDRFSGEVPEDLEALMSLPGVGRKTASVVMCQAFGKNAFPVDTHIHRLAKRWGLSDGSNVTNTENHLREAFPENIWGKVHLQIIYYGREYSPARGFDKSKSPICAKYYKDN